MISHTQRKEALPLQTLRMESSPQISAHDLITLCKMTSHALCYADHNLPPRRDPENPLLWRRVQDGPGVGRKDTIIVDIRTLEEYPYQMCNTYIQTHTKCSNKSKASLLFSDAVLQVSYGTHSSFHQSPSFWGILVRWLTDALYTCQYTRPALLHKGGTHEGSSVWPTDDKTTVESDTHSVLHREWDTFSNKEETLLLSSYTVGPGSLLLATTMTIFPLCWPSVVAAVQGVSEPSDENASEWGRLMERGMCPIRYLQYCIRKQQTSFWFVATFSVCLYVCIAHLIRILF